MVIYDYISFRMFFDLDYSLLFCFFDVANSMVNDMAYNGEWFYENNVGQ